MMNNKKPNEIGRIAGIEDLKKKMGFGPIQEAPRSYSERIKKEREEKVNTIQKDSKALLEKSIEYYNQKSGRKSTIIVGCLELYEELNKLTETQLFEVQTILDFGHDPFEGERLIVTIPDHNLMNHIISQIKKRIPGFEERVKLSKIENEESELQKQKQRLREVISQKQQQHKERTEPIQKPLIQIEEEIHKCDNCGKVCKTGSGLASHMKTHEVIS